MHEGNAHLSCRKEREGLSTFSAFITIINYNSYYALFIIIIVFIRPNMKRKTLDDHRTSINTEY